MEAIIKNIVGDMIANMENECVKVCQSYGFDVNKERLTQALTDARKFYDEGHRDGKTAALAEIVRCKDCKFRCETDDGEYNPEDIVCTYWETDGLKACDFCSKSERRSDDATD
jgi:NAD-dependent dihydropyrimidine dehydrogenase PreA subunit